MALAEQPAKGESMRYGLVSALLLLAAAILYGAGATTNSLGSALGASLCIAGVLCEVSFWIRGLRKKSRF